MTPEQQMMMMEGFESHGATHTNKYGAVRKFDTLDDMYAATGNR
jgi:hypothetical protein